MDTIKLHSTERVRQIFFIQLVNRITEDEESRHLNFDFNALNERYPHIINLHDFTGVNVDDLFSFITYETRFGADSIYNTVNDSANFPEYLYAFNELHLFEGNSAIKHLPPLYDRVIESSDSDLVAMYLFHSLYMYNKQGEFLNLVKHPNLYDNGQIRVYFLKQNYLAIEIEDDNNGIYVELYKYSYNTLNATDAPSIEILTELDYHSIDWGLNNLSNQLLNDKAAILLALNKRNSLNLRRYDISCISKILRDDADIAIAAVSIWEVNYKYISSRLQLDTELALKFVEKYPHEYEFLPNKLKADKDFLLNAVEKQPELIGFLPEFLQADKDLVLTAAKIDPFAFAYNISLAPQHFIKDIFILKKLVQMNPKVLLKLDLDLSTNQELLSIAIKKDAHLIKLIKGLQSDYNLVLDLTTVNGEVIQFLDTLQYNVRFALECVEKNGLNLEYFPEEIRSDESVVSAAYKQNNNALIYATSAVKNRLNFKETLNPNSSVDDLPF